MFDDTDKNEFILRKNVFEEKKILLIEYLSILEVIVLILYTIRI